ncbi:MAG: HdeD family acid-resistance protein, partial [Alphaproteobacteria bacterium]
MFASHYYNDDIVDRTTHEIKSHRGWYIFEGLLFILIGMAAFSMPGITALTIEFLLATLFLVGGVIRFTNGILVERYRWWRLLSGSVYAIAGAAIFMWPIAGLTALLAVVGALLLMEGIFDIGIAMTMRPAR